MRLAELIAARSNQLGLTFEKLAARAREQGYEISVKTFYALANDDEPRALPLPRTIKALAAALDVPREQILMAAGQSVDLVDDSGAADADALAAAEAELGEDPAARWAQMAETMPPEELGSLLEVVEKVVDMRQGSGRRSMPYTPRSTRGEGGE